MEFAEQGAGLVVAAFPWAKHDLKVAFDLPGRADIDIKIAPDVALSVSANWPDFSTRAFWPGSSSPDFRGGFDDNGIHGAVAAAAAELWKAQ